MQAALGQQSALLTLRRWARPRADLNVLNGMVEIQSQLLEANMFKITVRVLNHSPLSEAELNEPGAVLMRTFASSHFVLNVRGGEFVSLMDPSPSYQSSRRSMQKHQLLAGVGWVGTKGGARHTACSPIILYDYPKLAPESPGPLFNGTEIDKLLSLRILTLTDEEKREMNQVDAQARRLLERTQALAPDQWLRMHGTMREPLKEAAQ